jgi:hypothetical protein
MPPTSTGGPFSIHQPCDLHDLRDMQHDLSDKVIVSHIIDDYYKKYSRM